jgi:TolB protein
MEADGSNVTRVTIDAAVKDTPVMTPDGKTILMTINNKGMLVLASFSLEDRQTVFLTSLAYNSTDPDISPDGSRVVFASDRDGNIELYSMKPNGEQQTRLTMNDYGDHTPAWGSSTNEILYSKMGCIYLLSLGEKTSRMLSNKGDRSPRWVSR